MNRTTPSPATLSEASFVPIALAMAEAARAPSMRYFRTQLDVLTKSDESPVTVADRETEAAMRAVLKAQCPDHGILGEEHGRERLEAPNLWVIDPIDGTKSFITGSPLWGTLVALLHQGRPLLGLMDMPVLGERWLGVAGEGTQCNGHTVRASNCQTLAQARVYTTSPDAFAADEWRRFDALSRACALRRFGGDCYAYAQLAAGHVDLVVEAGLQPYDYLSLVCLVEGAGGCITDWQGRALSVESDGRVVAAATQALHALALERLSGA
jgi:myo-inositol-1(or 4)-monophosphatase